MAEKFVILYEGSDCEGIFDIEADAEEYILSLAEEAVYEDFLGYIMFPRNIWVRDEPEKWMTAEDYFDMWKLEDLEDIWMIVGNRYRRVPRQTSYSAMLSHFVEDYGIVKAHYFAQ